MGSANEVHTKRLSPEERDRLKDSGELEWKSTLDSGSVKVLDEKDSALCRSRFPDRVLSSRMVLIGNLRRGSSPRRRPSPDGASGGIRARTWASSRRTRPLLRRRR